MRAKEKAKPVSRAALAGEADPGSSRCPSPSRTTARCTPRTSAAARRTSRCSPPRASSRRRWRGASSPRSTRSAPSSRRARSASTRRSRTSTPTSSAASASSSARTRATCTPAAAATTRSRSTSGSSSSPPAIAPTPRSRGSQRALVARGREHERTILPGYTHLQRAQPVSLAHHLLAHVETLGRDRERLAEVRRRAAISPLGSGALAGTTLPLDREATARALGLAGVTQNSLDAVSDRDSAIELLFACALAAVHLSRLGEEIVLWTTKEFGFMTLADAFATGSLAHAAEEEPRRRRARARPRRRAPSATSCRCSRRVKSLPLSYNRDLAGGQAAAARRRRRGGADRRRASRARSRPPRSTRTGWRRRSACGEALATDAAEYLVERGRPVPRGARGGRQGGRVRDRARQADGASSPPRSGRASTRGSSATCCAASTPRRSLRRRELPGAPGPRQVARQLARWEKALRERRAVSRRARSRRSRAALALAALRREGAARARPSGARRARRRRPRRRRGPAPGRRASACRRPAAPSEAPTGEPLPAQERRPPRGGRPAGARSPSATARRSTSTRPRRSPGTGRCCTARSPGSTTSSATR